MPHPAAAIDGCGSNRQQSDKAAKSEIVWIFIFARLLYRIYCFVMVFGQVISIKVAKAAVR